MENIEIKKIYFDMDGVLADFEGGVRNLCRLEPVSQGRIGPEEELMWDGIRQVPHFYDRLDLIPGAKEMFDALYARYERAVELLTGIPKPERRISGAAEDKIRWAKRLLSLDVYVNTVLRKDKYIFCTGPDCVLIDDYVKNINEWERSGGIGILCPDIATVMKKLKELEIL